MLEKADTQKVLDPKLRAVKDYSSIKSEETPYGTVKCWVVHV